MLHDFNKEHETTFVLVGFDTAILSIIMNNAKKYSSRFSYQILVKNLP